MGYEATTIIVIAITFFVRNALVFSARKRAIDIAHEKAQANINAGADWRQCYYEVDRHGSYDKMLFDIRKWTFAQFYPRLEK